MAIRLSFPTRVSRLYPIFSLILLFSSGVFFYAWQMTQLELEHLPRVEERNRDLEKQVSSLTAQQKLDQATLQVQKQQITDTAAKLAALQKQLNTLNDQLTTRDAQLKKQEQQLADNASELDKLRTRPPLFSFANQSSLADVASKEADVKTLVSDAYPYVQQLYGQPYLLNSIKITFVDEFSIKGSAGEILISNSSKGISVDIHLKDFDKNDLQDCNTVIHEMIHAFHGVAVFESSALEEGITVAATDAVMKNMIADKKLPNFSHLYISVTDEQYQLWNKELTISKDNQTFYSYPQVAKVYQLIGKAWYRLWEADPNFFKNVNAAYYPKIQHGQTADAPLVLDAIRASIKQVNGQAIDTYLAANQAFNPS